MAMFTHCEKGNGLRKIVVGNPVWLCAGSPKEVPDEPDESSPDRPSETPPMPPETPPLVPPEILPVNPPEIPTQAPY